MYGTRFPFAIKKTSACARTPRHFDVARLRRSARTPLESRRQGARAQKAEENRLNRISNDDEWLVKRVYRLVAVAVLFDNAKSATTTTEGVDFCN